MRPVPAPLPVPSRAPGILLVSNYSNTTGYAWKNIHRLMGSIARDLRARGVPVFVSFAQIEAPIECIPQDIGVQFLEIDPYRRGVRALFDFIRLLRRHRIQVIYWTDQDTYRLGYAAMRCCGIKTILVHQRVTPALDAASPSPTRLLIKRWIGRFRAIRPDQVYVVSDFVRSQQIERTQLPAAQVITLTNGIDLSRFLPDERTPRGDEPFRILLCSRAAQDKGITVAIRALRARVDEFRRHRVCFEFAGDGPDLDRFKELTAELGLEQDFLFLGKLSNTVDAFRRADLVVVPSICADAYPSTVAEAMASGKPLVASRTGGIPEMIGGPDNGVLVEPNDEHELARVLIELIEDPERRRRLGRSARLRAEQQFDEGGYHQRVIRQILSDCACLHSPEDASDEHSGGWTDGKPRHLNPKSILAAAQTMLKP